MTPALNAETNEHVLEAVSVSHTRAHKKSELGQDRSLETNLVKNSFGGSWIIWNWTGDSSKDEAC